MLTLISRIWMLFLKIFSSKSSPGTIKMLPVTTYSEFEKATVIRSARQILQNGPAWRYWRIQEWLGIDGWQDYYHMRSKKKRIRAKFHQKLQSMTVPEIQTLINHPNFRNCGTSLDERWIDV